MTHARNFGIVALLALGVWALPGGGGAADVFGALLFVVLTIGLGLFSGRTYRENRSAIYSLGDRYRTLLYGALGAMVLTVAAGNRLFDTGLGTLAWLALMAASVYALFLVWRHSREF